MDICSAENVITKNRYISEKTKREVLLRQDNKCANNPWYPAINLSDYNCLLWKYEGGFFDASGYQFDHINEYSLDGNNSLNNIQALCPSCHCVKTKKFLNNKKYFTSTELGAGCGKMDL